MWNRWTNWLNEMTEIGPVVYFRIIFGSIMIWEVYRYFSKGWISKYWIEPQMFFPYINTSLLQPLPGNGMYFLFALLGICSLFIAIGFLYRISTVVFAIGFTYMFLLDKTHYLNHFYLISLISFAMILIPAHRNTSIDSWLWPALRKEHLPKLYLFAIQFLLGIAYFFGGIAKLNHDWLHGEPIRGWLRNKSIPFLGSLPYEWQVGFFSYGGLLFDLMIVPLLIYKPTRWLALVMMASFHLMNAWLFKIGIFPWMMLLATFVFLSAYRFNFLVWFKDRIIEELKLSNWKLVGFSIFFLLMILIPFRHFLYPGVVHWTEEGHRFSWHMKLRDKDGKGMLFMEEKATGRKRPIITSRYLTKKQGSKMLTHPDMIIQFAKAIPELTGADPDEIAVYAKIQNRLNGRAFQRYIKEDVDLLQLDYDQPAKDFVEPLRTELRIKN